MHPTACIRRTAAATGGRFVTEPSGRPDSGAEPTAATATRGVPRMARRPGVVSRSRGSRSILGRMPDHVCELAGSLTCRRRCSCCVSKTLTLLTGAKRRSAFPSLLAILPVSFQCCYQHHRSGPGGKRGAEGLHTSILSPAATAVRRRVGLGSRTTCDSPSERPFASYIGTGNRRLGRRVKHTCSASGGWRAESRQASEPEVSAECFLLTYPTVVLQMLRRWSGIDWLRALEAACASESGNRPEGFLPYAIFHVCIDAKCREAYI
jgi:hypothetical protein